ncbi:hypothetical protein CYFUS_003801 [Cystobacter fuscus]|uniref:Lipoprotein n=1 Tax=Cystobacter fuscus TaxID=43 RepID=A0A250J4G8_9BACT|nr:hypothetical protein [Cystobacter fuscus]ATB38367.1 hypothetical protein CYFUS_003801 [Cystobacter fuscus]
MSMGTRMVGWLAVGAALLGVGTVGCAQSGMASQEDAQNGPVEDGMNGRCDYEDPNRYYVSREPEQCARIRFVCPNPADSTPPVKPNYFSDRCGCGCEAEP